MCISAEEDGANLPRVIFLERVSGPRKIDWGLGAKFRGGAFSLTDCDGAEL